MPCPSRINAEESDCVYFVPQFCYSYFKLFIHSYLFQDGNQLSADTKNKRVAFILIILDTPLAKTSSNHQSEQTLGNKLYPIWLLSFGIIFPLMSTNFLNK